LNQTFTGKGILAAILTTEPSADANVRCVVLTGSEKAFAAGADIKEMAAKSYAEMFQADFFASGAAAVRTPS
jgi:enoyl-CoA hydratase/carnithine racemase